MSSRVKLFLFVLLIGIPVATVFTMRYFQDQRVQELEAAAASGERPGSGNQARRGSGAGGGPVGGGVRVTPVETALVRQDVIREQISLVGSLKPKEQVEIVPRITGRVEQLTVDVGDRVQEGQVIARLEDEELAQQVLRAEASLGVAEATIAQREAELRNAVAEERRAGQLISEGLLSVQAQETVQTRARVVESQLKLAQAQVRQAEAELQELRIRLRQTDVISPLTGWVARRYVHPGALVNPSTPIVNVLMLSSMVTQVRVPEHQFARLRVGNRAVVSIDAFQGTPFEGRVARISPLLDPATRSGSVEIEIPNPGGLLKAEMSARIQMDLGIEREVLLVPRDALLMRGSQSGVVVLDDDTARFQQIQTGVTTDQGVEVLDGLAAGATVVTRGAQGLRDGDRVQVQGGHVASGGKRDPS